MSRRADAKCHVLPITARGPDGLELSIDIAVLGSSKPNRALVHTSGIHGVEGFVGSAVQLGLLKSLPALKEDTALILVHVLNPFGMAWLRRVNELNVDLNRNFLQCSEQWQGANVTYANLDSLLNPATPPRFDAFYLRAALAVIKFGFAALQQAVAGGQHEFAKGLFYGGRGLEQGPQVYKQWLREQLPKMEKLVVIDVHSGLGPWSVASDLVQVCNGALSTSFYNNITTGLSQPKTHRRPMYRIHGGQSDAFTELYPDTPLDVIVQEFGTYTGLRVLHALRDENRLHHFGERENLQHEAKCRIKEVFCPRSHQWRQAALQQGRDLVDSVLQDL